MVSLDNNISSDCNFLFIISGPSGSGKTTICKKLLEANDNLSLSISSTTRPPRHNERDGEDYFFLTKEQFLDEVHIGGFLEYAEVFNNYYGTPLSFIHKEMAKEKNILFDIDWQGMRKIKSIERFNCVSLFLLPPSLEILKERLIGRGDSEENVNKRIKGFINDAQKANEYDYIIVNDDLQKTFDIINNIYKTEVIRLQRGKAISKINSMIQTFHSIFSSFSFFFLLSII